MVFGTLIHPSVKLCDLLIQQTFFNGLQIAKGLVISSEKLVKLVYMPHIIFFLKGNVDNGLRNFLANAIEELGFTNDNFQLW